MYILLIKMSSLGDLIHTLPAITDAMNAIPDLQIDWVVEPAFADIPTWQPAVKTIIQMPLRHWRKHIFNSWRSGEIQKFYKQLTAKKYDLIIDAQGLLKSAIVAKCARGDIHGHDKKSAKEFLSSFFYQKKHKVDKNCHAVTRARILFSKALGYELPQSKPDFHINVNQLPALDFQLPEKYLVFLHGTTWDSKHYPESYWRTLAEKADANGIAVYLLWGNDAEKKRAIRLSENLQHVTVLPKLSIAQIATLLKNAVAVVTVDTGLGHLSAALKTPTIGLYGPTDAKRVGILGDNQFYLQAQFPCVPCYGKTCAYAKTHKTAVIPACYETIGPDKVWNLVETIFIASHNLT